MVHFTWEETMASTAYVVHSLYAWGWFGIQPKVSYTVSKVNAEFRLDGTKGNKGYSVLCVLMKCVQWDMADSPNMVFFDLETTGLGPSCDIVQLAAVSGCHTLNLYMVPRCRMEPGASRITGFRVRRHRLFLHRRPVLTNSLREALVSFITFLRMFGRPLLVGHNIRRFDCLVLARVLDEFDLKAVFQAGIVGFLDSLPLTRQLLKDSGVQSFKQENLVKTVLGVSYAAHDALGDVQALQKLYWALRPTASQIQQYTFGLDSLCKKR